MSEEIWKDVVGFEGFYEVSNLGRVKRIARGRGARPWQCLTPRYNQYGYQTVHLCRSSSDREQKTIHEVVAAAFIGPRPSGHDINHLDGNKWNNRAGNLEYATRKENMAHAREVLGIVNTGENNGSAKLTREQVLAIRSLYASGVKQRVLADQFGVHRGHISMIVTRRSWKWLMPQLPALPNQPRES